MAEERNRAVLGAARSRGGRLFGTNYTNALRQDSMRDGLAQDARELASLSQKPRGESDWDEAQREARRSVLKNGRGEGQWTKDTWNQWKPR